MKRLFIALAFGLLFCSLYYVDVSAYICYPTPTICSYTGDVWLRGNTDGSMSMQITGGSKGFYFFYHSYYFIQNGQQFALDEFTYNNSTALYTPDDGWSGSGKINSGVTKSATITHIPKWFDFTASFQMDADGTTFNFNGLPCNYYVSYPSFYTYVAKTGDISVTSSGKSCSWTATSSLDWITITSGNSGTGSGTVTISVSKNTTGVARTGTITVAGVTLTITQASSCDAYISAEFFSSYLKIPIIIYNGTNYWATLKYNSTFSVENAGTVDDMSPYSNCTVSTLSSDLKLHIPSVIYNGAFYWVDLQWDGSVFAITGSGKN